jgi:hypothetical protein
MPPLEKASDLVLETLLDDLRLLQSMAETRAEDEGWCGQGDDLIDMLAEIIYEAEQARVREKLLFPSQVTFLRSVP